MATVTLAVACPTAEWTLIADGATVAQAGIQAASTVPVAIAVAADEPPPDSDDHIVLADDASVVLDLDAADKVYGRGLTLASKVRLYKVAR
jgi:hypothetical protein